MKNDDSVNKLLGKQQVFPLASVKGNGPIRTVINKNLVALEENNSLYTYY